jgi:hypothetical protein
MSNSIEPKFLTERRSRAKKKDIRNRFDGVGRSGLIEIIKKQDLQLTKAKALAWIQFVGAVLVCIAITMRELG